MKLRSVNLPYCDCHSKKFKPWKLYQPLSFIRELGLSHPYYSSRYNLPVEVLSAEPGPYVKKYTME